MGTTGGTYSTCIPQPVVVKSRLMDGSLPIAPTPKKRCSCCEQQLPLTSFSRNRQAKDGLHYYCRACAAAKQREWAANNAETVKRMRSNYLRRVHAQNATRDPYERQH